MACMCGDIMCPSCGPAQGNYRCSNCGRWASDGGCVDPAACAEADRLATEAEYQQLQEIEKAAAEFWASHPDAC
jgi:methionyl-tRNA synthetase